MKKNQFEKKNISLELTQKIIDDLRLTLFRMGFLRAANEWGEGKKASLYKICHSYPIMMKIGTVIPYLKKTQIIYVSHETFLQFYWHKHFFT